MVVFMVLLVLLLIFAPELLIALFLLIGLAVFGILEFILRLFGKSFDDIEPTEAQIKEAYINYADSHWTRPGKFDGTGSWSVKPMQHSYESFARECRENPEFYKKYKK
jgi:hypothetical protein